MEHKVNDIPLDNDELLKRLKKVYKKGYKYIVRDEGSDYLLCFSLRPKKYYPDPNEGFWGYTDRDINKDITLLAIPIPSDLKAVSWHDKQPTLIKVLIDYLGDDADG